MTEFEKHLQAQSEPMRLTNWFVDHPCKLCCCNFICFFIATFIVLSAGFLEIDDLDDRQFSVWTGEASLSRDKSDLLDEYIERNLYPERFEKEDEDEDDEDEDDEDKEDDDDDDDRRRLKA